LDDSAHAEFGPKPTQPCHPEHELGRWNSSRIYERIIYYYLSHENSIEPLTSSKDSLSALSDALRIITAEWLNVCHIIECEITKLSEQHENGEHTLEDMDDELKRFHTWRRRVKRYAEFVDQVLEDCKWRGTFHWCRHKDGEEIAAMRTDDFEAIRARFSSLKETIKDQMSTVLNEILIENSRLSRKADKEIIRLSIAAFVFLPLSWLAGLFSMNESIGVISRRWWIYVVVAIPLTALVVALGVGLSVGRIQRLRPKSSTTSEFETAQRYGYPWDDLY